MSHFTRLQTYIVDLECLVAALRDLGYEVEVGKVQGRGYAGNLLPVEVRAAVAGTGYDIGFRRVGQHKRFEAVADWEMLKSVMKEQEFLDRLHQRYAYHVAQRRLREQGFEMVEERQEEGGQISVSSCGGWYDPSSPGVATPGVTHPEEPALMDVQEIEVIIEKNGQVRVEVRGVKGMSCLDLTREVEAALGGEVVDRQMTPESLEQVEQEAERQHLGGAGG